MTATSSAAPERQAYYQRIDGHNLAPLWEVLGNLVVEEPKPQSVPTVWHYDEIRDFIMESGSLITAKEAIRRVLVLENPGLRGSSRVTESLYAGLQLILPGEVAPSHRHSQSALRFVVEGQGAYTAVDGERTIMSPGDFVITPSWTWHAVSRPEGDALARYGSGLLPVGYETSTPTSPVFNYPYERTREALEKMRAAEAWDPCHGLKMRYVNPVTGESAMPTMGTFMQLLPKDFETAPYRSSDGMVYSVVEGTGRTVVGEETLDWGPRDTFVVPSWMRHYHAANEDAVLFSFSDRPVHQKLGLWREDRGNH
jgi:gentisate 1,2-dioxygenase